MEQNTSLSTMRPVDEYWTFVSYRHADNQHPGREWASWIAREIETYDVPVELIGTTGSRGDIIPERIYPVFRDEDELSAEAELSSPIFKALDRSKTLLVICSPGAVDSRYVGNEISYFKSLGRSSRIISMIIEGEPNASDGRECFPEALKYQIDSKGEIDASRKSEPMAADFRLPDGSHGWHSLKECRRAIQNEKKVQQYRQKCELAKLKIIAGILGVPLNQLIDRDKAYQLQRARKRAKVISAVAAALAVLMLLAVAGGIFSWRKKQEAVQAKAAAEHAKNTAETLIQEIVYNMEEKLIPLGRLDLLDDVSQAAEEYFVNLPTEQINAESERDRSAMIDARARIMKATGDLDGTLQRYRQGLAITRQLALDAPDNHMLKQDLAISLVKVSDTLFEQNRTDEAQQLLAEAREIMPLLLDQQLGVDGAEFIVSSLLGEYGEDRKIQVLALATESPGIIELLGTSSLISERAGDQKYKIGEAEAALTQYNYAFRIQQALAIAQPLNRNWVHGQLTALDKISSVQMKRGDLAASAASCLSMIELTEIALKEDPADSKWREMLAAGLDRLASIAWMENRFSESLEKSTKALQIWRSLAIADPGNLARQHSLFVGLHKLALSHKKSGNVESADKLFTEARAIIRHLVDADSSNANWLRDLAFSLDALAITQRRNGKNELAQKTAVEAISYHQQLSRDAPDNLEYRRNLLIALNGDAINYWAMGQLNRASKRFNESLTIARSIVDDLPQPNLQSRKDLSEILSSLAQLAEQSERFEEAANWNQQHLDLYIKTSKLGIITEAEAEKPVKQLKAKIAELKAELKQR